MDVANLSVRVELDDAVANGMNQMAFSQTNTAVKKKRVVATARILSDLQSGGPCQLVGLAGYEGIEGPCGVESRIDNWAPRRCYVQG